VRWRFRADSETLVGTDGEIIATLTKPDGTQLTTSVLFEIMAAKEKEAKQSVGQIPPFDIKPITPENGEKWNLLWSDDNDDPDRQRTHAYKALRAGGAITVYYSTIFTAYRQAIDQLRVTNPRRVPSFEANYEIWIGYHAILQSQQQIPESSGLEEEVVDEIQERERQTVARVQARQALRTAELVEQRAVSEVIAD